MRMRPLWWSVSSLCLAACLERSGAAPLAPEAAPITVQTALVEERAMPRTLEVTGSLSGNREADVAADAAGRVVESFVERGDFVGAGAPLLRLDTRTSKLSAAEADAELERAQASQKLAEHNCERYRHLFDKGAISRSEWESANSECATSRASAAAAQARAAQTRQTLSNGVVRAPFAGLISERTADLGEYVNIGSVVARMVEISPIRLELSVAEADLQQVRAGQNLSFEVNAYPNQVFTATVRYVSPAVRSSSRDLIVEAVAANGDRRLRPGMFAKARLELSELRLPSVPRQAVVATGTLRRVFVAQNGRIEERLLQLGPERDGYVAVLDGLKAGESVVLEPDGKVADGARIN